MIGRPHAWCIDAEGLVVDPTFVNRRSDVQAYCGVVIPLAIAERHSAPGAAGTLMTLRATGELAELRKAVVDTD